MSEQPIIVTGRIISNIKTQRKWIIVYWRIGYDVTSKPDHRMKSWLPNREDSIILQVIWRET